MLDLSESVRELKLVIYSQIIWIAEEPELRFIWLLPLSCVLYYTLVAGDIV